MTVNRNLILDKVFEHRLEADFKTADAFLAADRADLVDGETLNEFLHSIEYRLRDLDPAKVHAAQNIVLELAGNALLHGANDGRELLLLLRNGNVVSVWMFGSGRKNKIERLESIIGGLSESADFDHREGFLRRRNSELLRRSSSPVPKDEGAGVGMLTIAALSSRPLFFKPRYGKHEASFALRSVV